MKTFTVSLPDEFAAFVERAVAAGKFDSVDHLVLYGLVQVEQELRADEAIDKEALRKAIRVGLDQLDRGERVDGPAFMGALLERAKEQFRAAQATP